MTDLRDEVADLSYQNRIERFIDILRSHGAHSDAYNAAEKLFQGSTDLGEDLDCAFRSYLHILLDEDLLVATNRTAVVQLLDYAIAFTLAFFVHHSSLVKIPYSMVDDILQSQTIQGAESIWPFIETSMESYASISTLYEAKYGNKSFLSRAQLNMLKACNALLRRLSKSCNTEFCGRVLMFLAKVFDISEKSAANLVGKINFTNLTQFESEQLFRESSYAGGAQHPDPSEDAMVVDGDDVSDSRGAEESKGDGVSSAEQAKAAATTAALKEGVSSLYEEYKTFWSLQTTFTTATADGKAIENITKWREFHLAASAVMKILSQHNYSKTEIRQAASATHRSQGDDTYAYMGCKFLTSSQLFALELRDPNLRQQVVTQVVYYLHHIAQKPTSFWESLEVLQEVCKDMLEVFQAAKEILLHTPGSDQLQQVLDRVLSREPHWVQWKFKDGCPPFERKISTADKNGESPRVGLLQSHLDLKTVSRSLQGGGNSGSGSVGTGKRRRPSSVPSSSAASSLSGGRKKIGQLDTSEYEFDYSDEKVKEKARQLADSMPTFENEIEKYFDAEDPDAGIDEEYHPKHDNTYCWKTRRLMAAKKLYVFSTMSDGNIAKALPLIRPPPPQPEATVSLEEMKEENAIAIEGGVGEGDGEKVEGDEIVREDEEGIAVVDAVVSDSEAVEVEMDVAGGSEDAGGEVLLPAETVADTTTVDAEVVAQPDSSSSSNSNTDDPLPVVDGSASPPRDIAPEAMEAVVDDDPTSVSSSGILPVADADPQDFVSETVVVAEAEDPAVTMQ